MENNIQQRERVLLHVMAKFPGKWRQEVTRKYCGIFLIHLASNAVCAHEDRANVLLVSILHAEVCVKQMWVLARTKDAFNPPFDAPCMHQSSFTSLKGDMEYRSGLAFQRIKNALGRANSSNWRHGNSSTTTCPSFDS